MFERLRLAAIIGGFVAGTIAATTTASASPLAPTQDHPSTESATYATPSLPAPPDGSSGAVGGEVSGVSGSTYSMAGPDGDSLSVTTTGSTTYANVDGSSASASSVKTGTFIMAEGTFGNQGQTLNARRITIGKPQGGIWTASASAPIGPADGKPTGVLMAGVAGKISSVSGSTYTIAGPDGSSMTVTATSSTTYANADGSTADASSVKKDVFIEAEGTPSNDGKAITADRITIGTSDHGIGLHVRQAAGSGPEGTSSGRFISVVRAGMGGEVKSVSGSTYTLAGPDGSSTTVTATGSTTYANVDGSTASAASVKVGVFIMAQGTPSDDGKSITAEQITIGKPQGTGFFTTGGERAR